MPKFPLPILCCVLTVLLPGCSTITIKDKDRTTDKSFDGTWKGIVNSEKSAQISDIK